MSARDDYPYLIASADGFNGDRMATEVTKALAEIDQLRSENQRLRRQRDGWHLLATAPRNAFPCAYRAHNRCDCVTRCHHAEVSP